MNLKVSIITINYNNKIGLEKTLQSITNQSSNDFEYIVIDGNSTDGSKDVLDKYADDIDIVVSESDSGIYNAMNKGIKKSSGEYLLFINSGDILYSKTVIESVLPDLNTADIVSGNIEFVGEKTIVKHTPDEVGFELMVNDTLWHPCTFIRKEAFSTIGFYDEELQICSDWKWFLLGFFKHNLSYQHIDVTIATFFVDGISSKSDNWSRILSERQSVLEKEFPYYYKGFKELHTIRIELKYYKNKYETIVKSKPFQLLKKLGFNSNSFQIIRK